MENTLAARLAWARNRAGFTQEGLAEGLRAKGIKISQSAIASWESGGHMTGRKIPAVAVFLGVSPLWLSDGTGQLPMSLDELVPVMPTPTRPALAFARRAQDPLRALVILGAITEREAALIARFGRLGDEAQRAVEIVLDGLPGRSIPAVERRR